MSARKNTSNTFTDEKYNAHIAKTMRGLLDCHPKTKERTTYKTLAEHLNVKQQSVSNWACGTTLPDTKHIKPIAEYFGVTCDYLLGRERLPMPDDFSQEVVKRLGLSPAAIEMLMSINKTPAGANKYNEDIIATLNDLLTVTASDALATEMPIGFWILAGINDACYEKFEDVTLTSKRRGKYQITAKEMQENEIRGVDIYIRELCETIRGGDIEHD